VSENVHQLYNDDLAAALKARRDFFDSLSGERREKALAFQREISAKLKTAGSVNNRLVLIKEMMFDKLMELESELKRLSGGLVCVERGKKDLPEESHRTLNRSLEENERKL
jgi:hypothetical protein